MVNRFSQDLMEALGFFRTAKVDVNATKPHNRVQVPGYNIQINPVRGTRSLLVERGTHGVCRNPGIGFVIHFDDLKYFRSGHQSV